MSFDKKVYEYYIDRQSLDGTGYHENPYLGGFLPIEPSIEYVRYLTTFFPSLDFKNSKVLDIGPRTFETYHYFLQNFNNKITGIELNKSALTRSEREGTGLIELDAHLLDTIFSPNSFDLILSFHSLEHMLDANSVVSQMFKVLKPGGFLYLVVPVPSGASEDPFKNTGHWLKIDNLIDMVILCEKHGFKTLHSEHIRSSPKEYVFRGEEGIYLFQKE
jgi:SAM-dependent methyltransferase